MKTEILESRLFFIEQRLEKLEKAIAPAPPENRCAKCGVPLESYQAYSCESSACPRPRTLA